MFSVRKVKTKSGSTAVQVVKYKGHTAQVYQHIGSAKNDDELALLRIKAKEWIEEQTAQISLFPDPKQKTLLVERGECIGVTHRFAWQFFMSCAKECSLGDMPSLLLDLAIMRLIEPASKLRSLTLLSHYFGIKYSERIYRNIPKLLCCKTDIEQHAFDLASEKLREPFFFVLYDVTTLYFESFKEDELKVSGFSKDNKPQQPQIVIGLLVTQSGFPLTYEVFSGNTFEGNTMLQIVENFIHRHKSAKPIIVADAAMLDEERLIELQQKNISYIVGARLANTSLMLIKKIHDALQGVNGTVSRFQSKHGHLICDFSLKRYKKETLELNKQVLKAEELVALQSSGSKAKFVKKITKETVALNIPLIEKRKLLLGIKGYCTNLEESELSNEQVISYYHQLWHIEQSFRMSKNDLKVRPIYHRNEDPIRSHVLICFVSLMIEKYLELVTGLSLRDIRFLVWDITESHIQDTLTKEVFVFRSPISKIMESPIACLVRKWKLLPH
jgi:hypothetical protein